MQPRQFGVGWACWTLAPSVGATIAMIARPAVQPKDGKPIPVPLSAEGLRDLDELAAEAKGRPRGSLLTGSAPLDIQSVPTSLLVLGGGTVVTVLLLAVGGLLWIAG